MTNVPIEPNERYVSAVLFGRRRAKTFEPSRGGIGMRLKIASRTFSLMIVPMIKPKNDEFITSESDVFGKIIQAIIDARIARTIFVSGPASETSAISFLPSLRLNGSTGTGFAPPKIIGEPEIMSIRGRRILIKGSM